MAKSESGSDQGPEPKKGGKYHPGTDVTIPKLNHRRLRYIVADAEKRADHIRVTDFKAADLSAAILGTDRYEEAKNRAIELSLSFLRHLKAENELGGVNLAQFAHVMTQLCKAFIQSVDEPDGVKGMAHIYGSIANICAESYSTLMIAEIVGHGQFDFSEKGFQRWRALVDEAYETDLKKTQGG